MQAEKNIVRYTLEASAFSWEVKPGKRVTAWGFNQQVPGPVLRAKQGETLVVKVINNLPEATMIHWHGVRLPANMDGTNEVQKPIAPGESFEYRFELPDAGTFWYHSHHNETTQMEKGMYGGIVVNSENDPVVDRDRILMIDDMKLTKHNDFKTHGRIGRWIERHDGREGNTNLVNGKENPTLHLYAGQTERWRIVNAASARYFHLSLDGKPFQVIATDGGLLEYPRTITELLITPGERFDILVGPFEEWENFSMNALPYDRVTMLRSKFRTYAGIQVMEKRPTVAKIPARLREIKSLAEKDATVNRYVKLAVEPGLKRGIDFTVNGELHHMDKPVLVGDLQVWEVSNKSLMDHPFHLHGFFFQVIEENGKTPAYLSWKDTYNLAPKSRIKIAWMPDNRPGRWMYHCHILEHHAAGMMAHFDVVDPTMPAADYSAHQVRCHA